MATSVDTMISNLNSQVVRFANESVGFAVSAGNAASGSWMGVPSAEISYSTSKPSKPGKAGDYKAQVDEYLESFGKQLQEYFCRYFPSISGEYLSHLAAVEDAVKGDSAFKFADNSFTNQLAQDMDSRQGERTKRELRNSFAARGFSLPPGPLFEATFDDRDKRSEALAAKSAQVAQAGSLEVVSSFGTILSTAMQTQTARTEAIMAMASLINDALAAYRAQGELTMLPLLRYGQQVEKALAYYQAEIKLDRMNAQRYKYNVNSATNRFSKDSDLFFMREGEQVRAAHAAAEAASDVAKAAFSALNTVVSASTVGFG